MPLRFVTLDIGHPSAGVVRGEHGTIVLLDHTLDPRDWDSEVLPLLRDGEADEWLTG